MKGLEEPATIGDVFTIVNPAVAVLAKRLEFLEGKVIPGFGPPPPNSPVSAYIMRTLRKAQDELGKRPAPWFCAASRILKEAIERIDRLPGEAPQ